MEKHYDVGILGVWFGCNYGSIATYYALHQAIVKMGKSVLMVHRPWIEPFDEMAMEKRHSMKFARAHYDISKAYNVQEIGELNQLCDSFVLGADQLWKYGVAKAFGHSYFLDFADKDKRKISFATSFGSERFLAPWNYMWKAVKCLRKMSYVSVREEVNVNMCKKLFGIEAKHVLDPVLLCESSCLGEVAEESERELKSNYIAAYILDPTEKKKEALLRTAEKYQKDLVVMLDGWPHLYKKNNNAMGLQEYTVKDLTVADWLFYIKHSDMVITDSFHGTCIAMLFERPFLSIINMGRGKDRFYSLLEDFKLMDRLVKNPDRIGERDNEDQLDYTEVNKILNERRAESMAWLENALNSKEEKHSVVLKGQIMYPLRVLKSILKWHAIEKMKSNKVIAKWKVKFWELWMK